MKVLVTGSSGFVGYHLALRLLGEGAEVCGVDALTPYYDIAYKRDRTTQLQRHDRFEHNEVRLEDEAAFEAVYTRFAPDVCVHLAGQAGVRFSLQDPRSYLMSNTVGSFNVLENARHNKTAHLVMASTSSVYGANTDYPFSETDRTALPLTIYAATKGSVELMAHSYSHLYDLPVTLVRFLTAYGPWGRPDMAYFRFTERIFSGLAIEVYNRGQMKRNFTYIDDLVESIRRLMDLPPVRNEPVGDTDSLSPVAPHRIVNIGNPVNTGLMDFIRMLETAIGKRAALNLRTMQPGDVENNFSDISLLQALTGYVPDTPVDAGLEQFVAWYRDYYRV